MSGDGWIAHDAHTEMELIEHIKRERRKHGKVMVQFIHDDQRTSLQNNALHLYCQHLADDLNAAGFDMSLVLDKLSKTAEIPWTKLTVKERLWRPVQEAMTGLASTKDAPKPSYAQIYQALSKILAENFGITTEFPQRKDAA